MWSIPEEKSTDRALGCVCREGQELKEDQAVPLEVIARTKMVARQVSKQIKSM